ncbi:unnamed protein product [Musa hybrid cultivar]
MAKVACELGSMTVVRWCAGREKQQQQPMGFGGGRRMRRTRRRRRGGTVRLGSRRRGLLLRRLVRWSQFRWRVVAELFAPLKKAVAEMVSGRELVRSQHLALPFICHFPVPLV